MIEIAQSRKRDRKPKVILFSKPLFQPGEDLAVPIKPEKTAGSWIDEGQAKHKAGEFDEAIACYSNALKLDPELAIAYYNRSLVREQIRKFAQAESDRQAAFRLDPKLAESWRSIARGCAAGEVDLGCRAFEEGDFKVAQAHYKEALRIDPTFANAHYAQGILYDDRGKTEQALSSYTEAIRLNPRLADAYFYRAFIVLNMGDYDKGLEDLNAAIGLNPNDAQYYLTRSRLHGELGDEAKAKADRKKALKLDPSCEDQE